MPAQHDLEHANANCPNCKRAMNVVAHLDPTFFGYGVADQVYVGRCDNCTAQVQIVKSDESGTDVTFELDKS